MKGGRTVNGRDGCPTVVRLRTEGSFMERKRDDVMVMCLLFVEL